MIRLPEGVEKEFWAAYSKIEEDKKMPYITSVERFGMEKGKKEGRKEGTYTAMYTLVHNARQQGLSDELISKIAGLDVVSVQKILNNEPVDLPPNLLNPAAVPGAALEAR